MAAINAIAVVVKSFIGLATPVWAGAGRTNVGGALDPKLVQGQVHWRSSPERPLNRLIS
jgi:hypothetical protein